MATADLTAAQLRAAIQYNPDTGEFMRVSGTRLVPLKFYEHCGYHYTTIGRKKYRAHRLAWMYVHGVWPAGQIDHINGNRKDNRMANLRDVSCSVNNQNMVKPKANNKSGFLGVDFCHSTGMFRASIRINGKNVTLGRRREAAEAHALYVQAKRQNHAGCML